MNQITVIMPTWIITQDLFALTKEAIHSLGDVRLIIVDNASPIGGGYLRSIADIYVRNPQNLGYAKAVNQGLKLAGDELIAVVNNDIRVSPNWQEVTKEIFASTSKAFSVHLRMTDYETPFVFGDNVWVTGKERWCQGSFFIIDGKKKQFYDEEFLNSYDDWNFFYRARNKGYATVYTNKACFQHKHSSTQLLNSQRVQENERNAELFKKKHGDYAENLFMKTYPDQMKTDWKMGFDEGL